MHQGMNSVLIVGMQWGDEGKGKVIDLLSEKASYVVRCQGGNNAGHTIVVEDEEYKFNLIPSGILYPHVSCGIGGGTVIDPEVLLGEITGLENRGIVTQGRLHISPYAHIILPYHKLLDQLYEKQKGKEAIGTTGRGIGPCYMDKSSRMGIRVCELIDPIYFEKRLRLALELKNQELQGVFKYPPLPFEEIFEAYSRFGRLLKPYVFDVEREVFHLLKQKKKVLLEGAQGTLLDITFGTYPFVTSSSTLASGIALGTGIGPKIDHVLGIVKSYTTRVGAGPLPTALSKEEEALFLDPTTAREIGTTTGRTRRMGWFDAPLVRYSARLNGADSLALMKLDVLDHLKEIKVCVGYRLKGKILEFPPPIIEEFEEVEPIYEVLPGWQEPTVHLTQTDRVPPLMKRYIERLAALIEVPISMVSVGPKRSQTIHLQPLF